MFDENGEPIAEDPWASIVDLMSALVLVLFLAVIFFVTNYSQVSEELEVEKENLIQRSADLERTRLKLKDETQARLDLERRERLLLAEAERLKGERAALVAETEKLKGERVALTAETEQLKRERSALTAETERLTSDRVALTARTETLERERAVLTSTTERLEKERAALTVKTERLSGEQVALTAKTEDLKAQRVALVAERKKLIQERAKLKKELQNERDLLRKERAEFLADQKRLLGDKDKLSSETERLNAQVLKLQAALREAAEQQSSMMSSLAQSFKDAKAKGVSVDREAGKIILKSEVLFSKGKSSLTEEGRVSLRGVSIGLMKVLADPKMRSRIEGVMIEGHTSSSGAFERNLQLSSERALNTLEYMLSSPEMKQVDKETRRLFFAGAFGPNRPVVINGREDPKKSRRIEIRVLFNQSTLKSLTDVISK